MTNGRLGRLVAVLQLVTAQDLRLPVINLSPWFEQRRSEYQDQLLRVSQTGDFEPWVRFFCRAVLAQSEESRDRLGRLLAAKEAIDEIVRTARVKGTAVHVAQDLIERPMVTATNSAHRYGVSYQAANTAIRRLVDLGILRQYTRGKYARVFGAPSVLDLL